ncbi:MAG: SDR family NAD(P)-dependent oxidoreductase [Sphingomonas sp.]|nr:SDR family NAD(P)-dependent oxidoreductase [Sphingomonas sp.]
MAEMRFDDDVVIITGAGRGLGREHALAFARRGAAVVVNDLDAAAAQDVVAEITAAGGRAIADRHSVVDAPGAQAIVAATIAAFGKVTVLVNNAGVIDFALLVDIDDAAWRRMIAVTLDGAFQMSKAVWPHFVTQGHGRIVNTTSNAGFAGNETLVHYGAAKMGVAGLTRALAQEVGETGITVNAIAPMAVTRMNRDVFFGGAESESDDWQADIRDGRVPMGPPSIVSPTVLWLAHRSTTINSEIFSTSSGKVARLAFVLSDGFFDPDHTPETLRDHAEQIRMIGQGFEPRSTGDELMLIPPLFGA